ncbi:MAG: hypothetical protein ABIH26_15130 [Candidatus Eisenbacteria bacterium]
MKDRIYESFLVAQHEEGMSLAASSDLLDLNPIGPLPPRRYIATLRCKGLAKDRNGEVVVADHFQVGIQFPPDYLRRVNVMEVLHWLTPEAFHPNIVFPAICVGRLNPGTPLVDLLYQIFDLVSGKKLTPREDDALNREACEWARNHPECFPVDRRPLKRRKTRLNIERVGGAAGPRA